MSELPAGFDRQDAMLQGMMKTIQALTAVVYNIAPNRELLEKQLKIYLDEKHPELSPDFLELSKLPIQAALHVISEIKNAQPQK